MFSFGLVWPRAQVLGVPSGCFMFPGLGPMRISLRSFGPSSGSGLGPVRGDGVR